MIRQTGDFYANASKQWINLIFECISTPRLSVLINGTPKGFFEISKGLRQGDPISPFLFIIMAEDLGRSIVKAHSLNQIKGIKVTNDTKSLSHQQFADDTMLLGATTKQEARNFKRILMKYMKASGQLVNQAKSEIFFLNTPPRLKIELSHYLGYKIGKLPCKYLGLPLDKGRRSNRLWDNKLSKVDKKFSSWKNKWLSMTGKTTLLKIVLLAIPIYQSSCMSIPNGVREKLDKKLKHFYQNGPFEQKKLSLIAWDKLCRPTKEGGFGLKNLAKRNLALGSKLVWKMYKEPNLKWARLLRHKYLSNNDSLSIFRTTNPPKGSRIWNFLLDSRNLILEQLSWDVAKGDQALFWENSWGGYSVLEGQINNSIVKDNLSALWGRYVKYCIELPNNDPTLGWRWKSLDNIDIPRQERETLENLIKNRILSLRNDANKLVQKAPIQILIMLRMVTKSSTVNSNIQKLIFRYIFVGINHAYLRQAYLIGWHFKEGSLLQTDLLDWALKGRLDVLYANKIQNPQIIFC